MGTKRTTAFSPERAAYEPQLEEDLQRCIQEIRNNEQMFDFITEPELIAECIYRHEALACRYAYLLRRARQVGVRGRV